MELNIFLAHAVTLEQETEEAYLELVELMVAKGHSEAAHFFREMAAYCGLHRIEAMKRAGFNEFTEIHRLISFSQGYNFELPDVGDAKGVLDLDGAMTVALAAEKRGAFFYEEVAKKAINPQTRCHAEEFAAEERGHVLKIERFFGIQAY
ncbi:MAG: hypothetical protein R8K20_10595 [Gallionellaceae bacterium]